MRHTRSAGLPTRPRGTSIGNLTQLTDRSTVDKHEGQVDIDTATSSPSVLAGSTATATSFDFYGKTRGYVTPLIFNYEAGTYKLTGIGGAFYAGKGSQGIPFITSTDYYANFVGNATVTSTSCFGFYDGEYSVSRRGSDSHADAGVIPFDPAKQGSAATWLSSTTGDVELKLGMTFSSNPGAKAKVLLTGSGTYSAMLNE